MAFKMWFGNKRFVEIYISNEKPCCSWTIFVLLTRLIVEKLIYQIAIKLNLLRNFIYFVYQYPVSKNVIAYLKTHISVRLFCRLRRWWWLLNLVMLHHWHVNLVMWHPTSAFSTTSRLSHTSLSSSSGWIIPVVTAHHVVMHWLWIVNVFFSAWMRFATLSCYCL